MRRQPANAVLLFGPYQTPDLRIGDRAICQLRDCQVVVTSWSAAPIPWPRCRALEGTHGGGSGLLLTGDLVHAVRNESAAAVCWHWGVTAGVVWRWRKALGIRRDGTEGSRRLIQAASAAGGKAIQERGFTDEHCDERSRLARWLNLAQYLPKDGHGRGPPWSREHLQLLGTLPDADVAARIGRTEEAVRVMRSRQGIPNPAARPGAYHSPDWTSEEDYLVRNLTPRIAAKRLGRTIDAVYSRRSLLGVKSFRGSPGKPRRLRQPNRK